VVGGAASEDDAVEVGRAIARNNLLKCALFGNDPNWGRVLAAVGTTSAAFEPDRLDVSINGVEVCRAGAAGEPRDRVDLAGRAVTIAVDLHAGAASSTIRTTDLSYDYVRTNSAYST
jgi:glutamate N-acetyltransferase/amino-acid N-acetyltransferase